MVDELKYRLKNEYQMKILKETLESKEKKLKEKVKELQLHSKDFNEKVKLKHVKNLEEEDKNIEKQG